MQAKGGVNRFLVWLADFLRDEAKDTHGYTLLGIVHESSLPEEGKEGGHCSIRIAITAYQHDTGVSLKGKWLGFLASRFPDQMRAHSWVWACMDGMFRVWVADMKGRPLDAGDLKGLLVSARHGPRAGTVEQKWPRYRMNLGTIEWWCQYVAMGIAMLGLGRVQSKAAGGEALIGRPLQLRVDGRQFDTFMMKP